MHDPQQQAPTVRDALERVHRALEREVRAQRLAGASWSAVGKLLGTSRQAAHRRWRYLEDYPVLICVTGSVDDGTRSSWFTCPETGAAVGTDQFQQVAVDGRVSRHHPEMAGVTPGCGDGVTGPGRIPVKRLVVRSAASAGATWRRCRVPDS